MKVYVLKSTVDQSQYVGISNEPELRLRREHNKGKVKSTKSRIPWEIVFVEEFETQIEHEKEKNI